MDIDVSTSVTPLMITCMCGEELVWWRNDLLRQSTYSHPGEENASFTLTDEARSQGELTKVGDWLAYLHSCGEDGR